jgi:DNA-binding response OmpR family regulator
MRELCMEDGNVPSRKTVFVVDDEPDITSVIKMGLEQKGFVVHAFNDPNKALEELRLNGRLYSCLDRHQDAG